MTGLWIALSLLGSSAVSPVTLPMGSPSSRTSLPLGRCEVPVRSVAELRRHMQQTRTNRVLFFASWCGDCRAHVVAAGPQRTLLVGTFDAPGPLTAALQRVQPRAPCRLNGGVAEALGVTAVPALWGQKSDGGWVPLALTDLER